MSLSSNADSMDESGSTKTLSGSVSTLMTELTKIIQLHDQADEAQMSAINTVLTDNAKVLTPMIARMWKMVRQNAPAEVGPTLRTTNEKYPYCYVCKVKLWKDDMRHTTYTGMCWLCGNLNMSKRDFKKNLFGCVAVVTGGRVKIGYETAIRLLRNGCTVIVTSRFVDDCLERYQTDSNYSQFKDRLFIYQLNMLSGENINKFIKYVMTNFKKVDFLINNAAQTIKRPKEFFNHLLVKYSEGRDDEKLIVHRDQTELLLLDASNKLLIGYDDAEVAKLFPAGELDMFGQQIDLRTNNSWMLEAEEVDIQELAEVYIINSIGPYMLSTKLRPMMSREGKEFSWIVNVTSMEGVFAWDAKPSRHPHTNMAKASLNMFTRTCGQQFIKSNIVMICVDTGWNNPQQPNSYDFKTPVDCADGAARILDPIYRELKQHSVMYKDYKVHPW
ncbi:SDR family NAD(P)-dependent oxidoreductase [Yasminevirus sp. GU-2018]|uniref:SDR family NAD(P)-dependent oxidoreductase n=1 Tax=Yasminevirus sp. GU-2018 TaxID=2420051 RepID=A0A5K0UAI2_9VIRU|nr:SDR family NAD(P)-dependent oxidoreductase [Yasminevirus sp. GU-2018]